MTKPIIETPRGAIVINKGQRAELKWNTNFQPKWQTRYTRAQRIMDSEVLRGCEPYIPLRTGTLIKSGILGTDVGSGEVAWIVPYAKAQYYRPKRAGSETGALRGSFWFERWKSVDGAATVARVRRVAGSG